MASQLKIKWLSFSNFGQVLSPLRAAKFGGALIEAFAGYKTEQKMEKTPAARGESWFFGGLSWREYRSNITEQHQEGAKKSI